MRCLFVIVVLAVLLRPQERRKRTKVRTEGVMHPHGGGGPPSSSSAVAGPCPLLATLRVAGSSSQRRQCRYLAHLGPPQEGQNRIRRLPFSEGSLDLERPRAFPSSRLSNCPPHWGPMPHLTRRLSTGVVPGLGYVAMDLVDPVA